MTQQLKIKIFFFYLLVIGDFLSLSYDIHSSMLVIEYDIDGGQWKCYQMIVDFDGYL